MRKLNGKIIISFLVVGVICFGLGFFLGSNNAKSESSIKKQKDNNTFEAGWNAAKKRLRETGFVSSNSSVKRIRGIIKNIESDSFTVAIDPITPLADPDLDKRIVHFNQNTTVYKLMTKNQTQLQKETEGSFKEPKIDENKDVSKYNDDYMPYAKNEVNISSLETGQRVQVRAQKDIKKEREFKATEIYIMPTSPESNVN